MDGMRFVLLFSLVFLAVFGLVLFAKAAIPPPRPIVCSTMRPQILVKSSMDGKTYKVDVCSIAESAEGEDFRTEVTK
jgi:hypothetical protein